MQVCEIGKQTLSSTILPEALECKFTESNCIGLTQHTNFHTLIVRLKCREVLQTVGQLSSDQQAQYMFWVVSPVF
jgi:hypothetical protein